ncbi:hypothetical protein GCM10010469_09170 [Streptomyces labedae]|uniref:Uncharacterized protein n=1 Tax=Streptomyces labedae TaxID=285569 RepID=A0ABP6QS44_9ACTN
MAEWAQAPSSMELLTLRDQRGPCPRAFRFCGLVPTVDVVAGEWSDRIAGGGVHAGSLDEAFAVQSLACVDAWASTRRSSTRAAA